MRLFITGLILSGMLFVFGPSVNAQQKRIGMKKAQQIASTRARGLVLKAKELEKEHGKWIYSFEFKNKDGSVREVNVDAYSGKVIGVEREDATKEASEEKTDNNKKN